MFQWLGQPDLAAVILRLTLAAIFVGQGGLKIWHCDGGSSWFPGPEPLHGVIQVAVAWGELVCGLALLIGFLTRVAALGVIVIMLGALYHVTWRLDFTSLQTSSARGFLVEVGYEYNYAIIAMCACLVILGAGLISVDHFLWQKKPRAIAASPPASPDAAGPATL